MKYVLDTHVFLWLDHRPKQLSETVKTLFSEKQNSFYFSVVSVWEIQIKTQLGKLNTPATLAEIVSTQIETNKLHLLPIALEHIYSINLLPSHHKDPFDRLLISQAITEGLILLTDDSQMSRYPLTTIW